MATRDDAPLLKDEDTSEEEETTKEDASLLEEKDVREEEGELPFF